MKKRHLFLLLILTLVNISCEMEDMDIIIVEGYIKDDASNIPLAGITINVDAIKSPSGMGIITDGKRKKAGETVTTDANGHYKVKLRVFEEAERLEFWLNQGGTNEAYDDSQRDIYLLTINRKGHNIIDFNLTPIALLKIKFKNETPVSNADFFYFGWSAEDFGSRGSVNEENCGSVIPSEARTWTGMDVCGSVTVKTVAERPTLVGWSVKKNNITKEYYKSVYVKRGTDNEFNINY